MQINEHAVSFVVSEHEMHLHDILRNGSDVTELYFNAKYKKKMKNSVEKDAVQKS